MIVNETVAEVSLYFVAGCVMWIVKKVNALSVDVGRIKEKLRMP